MKRIYKAGIMLLTLFLALIFTNASLAIEQNQPPPHPIFLSAPSIFWVFSALAAMGMFLYLAKQL